MDGLVRRWSYGLEWVVLEVQVAEVAGWLAACDEDIFILEAEMLCIEMVEELHFRMDAGSEVGILVALREALFNVESHIHLC